MTACAWVHLYGGATRRAGGDFFFPPHSPLEQVHLDGEATLKNWGAVLLYALVCGIANQIKKKGGVGRGGLAGAPIW